ncbi:MAG TPA: hypothetical protein VFJ70_21360 [Burkholderiales bacterium]|nr:hypothetical protein [Burkholderiales bacterium]
MAEKPSRQLIVEQAEKLLGRKQLAKGLQVSEDEIRSWRDGKTSLSDSQLLKLSDLLAKYAAGKHRR